jgi:hypothetical protein
MKSPASSVAAVLDGYGGWHTVVAPHNLLKHHVRPGQLMLVVPHYRVREPVPVGDIPTVIRRAELYVLEWIGSRNDPDALKHPAVALFLLRRKRTYHCESVNLYDIVET